MTPEQITRNFVCDPAIRNDAELAIQGIGQFPALSKFLQAKPLDTLMFFGDQRTLVDGVETHIQSPAGTVGVPKDEEEVVCGGIYNPWRNLVAINTGYKNNSHVRSTTLAHMLLAKPFTAAVTPMMSFTVLLARVDTVLMIHEISHMIDFKHVRKNDTLGRFVTEAALSAYTSRRFVSRYAGTCPDEWFAETMSAYVVHPEVLKDFDPLAFAAMKAALETPPTMTKGTSTLQ